MFGKWNLLVLWFSVVVEGEVERRNGQKIKKGDKPRIWDRRKFGDVAVQTIWLKKLKWILVQRTNGQISPGKVSINENFLMPHKLCDVKVVCD